MSKDIIKQLKTDLATRFPHLLVDALITSYLEIKEQYYLGKHEPAELNGGKLVEAVSRLIQQELTGNHTPIGSPIGNMTALLRSFETLPSTYHESFRIHIPRALLTIYTIRNRRGVGHLGGDVNPNLADATLIATTADWILAELYRVAFTVSQRDAQAIVDSLVRRRLLLVHEIGTVKRILDPSLKYSDQTLLLLASVHPSAIQLADIVRHLEYSNPAVYKATVIKSLHKKRLIECTVDGSCTILPPGLKYVEKNYGKWMDKLNK